jgi:hypothetical protein
VASACVQTAREDFDPASDPRRAILPKGPPSDFLSARPVGDPPRGSERPQISNVRIVDLDDDRLADIIVSDTNRNQVSWIRQFPQGTFTEHPINGGILAPSHVEPIDFDGDGDLDLVVASLGALYPDNRRVGSVVILEHEAGVKFRSHVDAASNPDFGSSWITVVDVDQDGDPDILYSNGDAFDYAPANSRPWHGVQWLENRGHFQFELHRIADLSGASSPQAVDVDGDGDQDVVVVSAYANWNDLTAQSLVWLENDGRHRFTAHDLASSPTHLITLAVGDVDGNGTTDFVTGGMHISAPFDRMSRVILWSNGGSGSGR